MRLNICYYPITLILIRILLTCFYTKPLSIMTSEVKELVSIDLLSNAKKSTETKDSIHATAESVDRYEKFLILNKKYPEKNLVPTHDIDFMWHIHMLNPRSYWSDCISFFGDILDHNAGFGSIDSEKAILEERFIETSKLWEKEFGSSYILYGGAKSCTSGCST